MELNRSNMKKIIGIITFTVFLVMILQHAEIFIAIWDYLIGLLLPFIIGGCIAFVLNVAMRKIEGKLFSGKKIRNSKIRRAISLLVTLCLLTGILLIICLMVIPEIMRSIRIVGSNFPVFYERFMGATRSIMQKYKFIDAYNINWESVNWPSVSKSLLAFLANGSLLQNTVGMATSFLSGLASFILGLVFAIYVLLQKENLSKQIKSTLYAFLPEKKVDKFLEVCTLAEQIFSNFIAGQCLEAVILGSMFFITMSIFHLPYALMIGALISVTALIPIFGAFIGCAVGTFLIFIDSPVQALWFIVLFLALQQIEGNLIYPHVVGSSVGLPPIWVLVAVTLGAGVMGILGMLIAIPIMSVVYSLVKSAVHRKKEVV